MTHRRVILDERSEVQPLDGFLVVDSDVAFLRYAAAQDDLHIQGRRLCEWARLYFAGRLQAVEEAQTLREKLLDLVPKLSDSEAARLTTLLQETGIRAAHELDKRSLMNVLCPGLAWWAHPDAQHAAAYLVWLIRADPDAALQKLVEPFATSWETVAPAPLNVAYSARSAESARDRFFEWIGIGESALRFPAVSCRTSVGRG